MKWLLCSAVASFAIRLSLLAAISVGPKGSGIITFDTLPPASEWSTATLYGASIDIRTAPQLDVAVQTNVAAGIVQSLAESDLIPPPAMLPASWSSTGRYVQTRPAGDAYQVLMATLQNHTGSNLAQLEIAYDLGMIFLSGEEVWPRLYFSLSGTPGSWQLVGATSNAGPIIFALDLGAWPSGASLYLLWADDNSSYSPDTAMTIDNFVAAPPA